MAYEGCNLTMADLQMLGKLPYARIVKGTQTSTKEGVYLIDFGDGVKVGRAKNIKNRLASYTRPWMREIKRIEVYLTKMSIALELKVKTKFKDKRVSSSPEYFKNVSWEELVAYLDRKLRKNERLYLSRRKKHAKAWADAVKPFCPKPGSS